MPVQQKIKLPLPNAWVTHSWEKKKYLCMMTPVLAFDSLVTVHRAYARTWRQGCDFSVEGKNAQKYAKIGHFFPTLKWTLSWVRLSHTSKTYNMPW